MARPPWWMRPYGVIRTLRKANANQRDMILGQQQVSAELRAELRSANALVQALTHEVPQDPPDWVIMGKRDEMGLMVLGSDKPTHAEVTRKIAGHLHPPGQTRPLIPVFENKVLFTTPDLTVIRCESYALGLQSLTESWHR